MALPFVDRSNSSLPVQFVLPSKWRSWVKEQNAVRRGWLESLGVSGNAGDFAVLPGRDGKASGAVLVLSAKPTRMLRTLDLKSVRPRDLNDAAMRAARTELKQLLGVLESEETAA